MTDMAWHSTPCQPVIPLGMNRRNGLSLGVRRGRWPATPAHAVAVGCADSAAVLGHGARRRTRCVRFAPLRSNSCAESVYEACVSFGTHAAPRPARLAAPEIARAAGHLPRRDALRLIRRWCRPQPDSSARCIRWWKSRQPVSSSGIIQRGEHPRPSGAKAPAGPAQRASGAPRSAVRPAACVPKDTHASSSDLPQLFERSERSERSEFCGRPVARASQGSRSAAKTAPVKRSAGPAGDFARGAPVASAFTRRSIHPQANSRGSPPVASAFHRAPQRRQAKARGVHREHPST